MSNDIKVHSIAPIIAVRDSLAAAAFYSKHLGFGLEFIMPDDSYAVLSLQGQHIHLTQTDDESALKATANNATYFIAVTGIDAYWAEVEASKPPTKVNPLETKPWGVREFHILDLDGALIRVGENA